MEQSRKHFLKNFLIGATSVPLILEACKKDAVSNTSTTTTSTSTSGNCTVSPTETAGPFPALNPSSLLRSDIRLDRMGAAFTIKITVADKNNGCAALSGAIVDIWHCDKAGNYSEYGGSGMQSINYTVDASMHPLF